MKRLILASLAVAALASCSKESTMDVAITSAQIPMQFSTYAGSSTSTKGTPINTNTAFKGTDNEFEVSAYANLTATSTFGKYFGFSTVQYDSSAAAWSNVDDMYYPNEDATILFGAYYPSAAAGLDSEDLPTFVPTAITAPVLTIPYTVLGDYPAENDADIDDQDDLMYAVKSFAYTAPVSSEAGTDTSVDSDMKVNLHFKHALTQVAFTATKDSDLDVEVRSITICNVINSGTFVANTSTDTSATETLDDGTVEDENVDLDDAGAWTPGEVYNHYVAAMDFAEGASSIEVGDETTTLTNAGNALMLIPQILTAWDPTDGEDPSTNAYLAIDCTILHADAEVAIIDGVVFVPFSTANIDYAEDADAVDGTWAPGYKITYNLVFGGGYTYPGDPDPEIPEPGDTPDPDEVVPTLRAITYTTTVDEWVPVAGGSVTL
ncbi:MAG: fimbrillin family protein [Rikenellaceae bacterium]